jgi:hypothetical protein
MTPSGIETATFRFAAHFLNQLRHTACSVLQCNNLVGNCIFKVRIPKIPRIYGKNYNIEVISNASFCTTMVILTQEFPKAYLEQRETSDGPRTMKITKQT